MVEPGLTSSTIYCNDAMAIFVNIHRNKNIAKMPNGYKMLFCHQVNFIGSNLQRFFATMFSQVTLESLFVRRAWTLPVVWGWFGMVEKLLWALVQVFGSWVWFVHPGNSFVTRELQFSKNLPSSVVSVRPPFEPLVLVPLESASEIFYSKIIVKLVRCIDVLILVTEISWLHDKIDHGWIGF